MEREPVTNRLNERLHELRQLRDEIRLDIHLAGMDAKQKWKELEPALTHAEQLAGQVSEISRDAVEKIVQRFQDFRSEVHRHAASTRKP